MAQEHACMYVRLATWSTRTLAQVRYADETVKVPYMCTVDSAAYMSLDVLLYICTRSTLQAPHRYTDALMHMVLLCAYTTQCTATLYVRFTFTHRILELHMPMIHRTQACCRFMHTFLYALAWYDDYTIRSHMPVYPLRSKYVTVSRAAAQLLCFVVGPYARTKLSTLKHAALTRC